MYNKSDCSMIKTKILAVIAVTSLLTSLSAWSSSDASQVKSASEKLRVSMITPDKESLESLTAEKLSYGHSSGNIEDRKTFVSSLMTGNSNFLDIDISDQHIDVFGDTSVVRHTLLGDLHNKGKAPYKITLKVLQIWKRIDGDWKLLARQSVKI